MIIEDKRTPRMILFQDLKRGDVFNLCDMICLKTDMHHGNSDTGAVNAVHLDNGALFYVESDHLVEPVTHKLTLVC